MRLFHRSTRAITLTPEGELFLESCRRIFSEINKIELELSQSKTTPTGRLKVSLPDVGMLMMPTLHGFMREYPDIQIDAEFTDNVVDVIEGGYDAVKQAAATRVKAFADAAQNEYYIALDHMYFPGIGRVTKENVGYRWLPVPYINDAAKR